MGPNVARKLSLTSFLYCTSQSDHPTGMPPPPPPSKSYLLVIDSDSSGDEDDSYRIYHREQYPVPVITPPDDSSPASSESHVAMPDFLTTPPVNRRRPHVIDDELDDEADPAGTSTESDDDDSSEGNSSPRSAESATNSSSGGQVKLTKNQKKKRARRRNQKKAKSCATQDRRIKFSTVSVRVYDRAFSHVSVPADGGWPLGMELKPTSDAPEDVAIDDFEAQKQEKLKERWEKLLGISTTDAAILDQMTKRPDDGTPLVLETRQWDYRSKMKNPLFGMLSEEQRQDLLLEASEGESGDNQFPPKGRARSNSVGDQGTKQNGSSPKRRARAESFSHTEHFSEKYNQVYVHHVRNELEQLRNERTKSGATGCNCRKLTVYIPPKNGGGKKAAHRRLKPSKLRDELKKRNMYDESKSREKLEQILHDAVEKEPCCGSSDCFCHRNGIDCQADACSCWHDSHVHEKSGERYLSVETISARCGNPSGTTVVDVDAIDSYRARVLESTVCQFIGSAQ